MIDAGYIVGIDPGVKTGLAVWCPRLFKFTDLHTCDIIAAQQTVVELSSVGLERVYLEDARKRSGSQSRRFGAGSVTRDCKVWESFLKANGIPYSLMKPVKNWTKTNPELFKKTTGWEGRTSQHARDAAMLVYGRTK